MNFLLTTDTSCDFFKSKLNEKNVPYLSFVYSINGQVHFDDFDCDKDYSLFYDKIKEGCMPTTSQINPEMHKSFFSDLVLKGHKQILHLSLSGGLSATVQNAINAASEVMQEHPDVKIIVVDTLAATIAHGRILIEAIKLRDNLLLLEDAATYLNEFKHRVQAWLVVDDLMHLKRGGRISGAAAYIGTLLRIKPIIIINKNGGLTLVHKAKGSKAALKFILEKYKELGEGSEVTIASGDADFLSDELAELFKNEGSVLDIVRGHIGPIIGTHTGPGSMGIVFVGKQRLC